MDRKPWLLSLLILFLFTGTAFAQTSSDGSPSEAEQECKERYQRDMAEAEEDYQKAQEEQRSSDDASQDGSNESRSSEEAKEDYEDDRAEAERRYQECLADAREDAADEADDEADDRRDEQDDREAEGSFDLPPSYSGRHVAFDVTRDGVANYSVDGARILASVSTHRPVGWDEIDAEGASIRLEGEGAELKVSDTSTGVFRFESEDDRDVVVTFAPGVTAEPAPADDRQGPGKSRILLQGDGFRASLFVEEGYDLSSGQIISPEEVRMVVIDAPGLARKDMATVEGIADGRIAVEVDVSRGAAPRAAQHGDVNVTLETVDGDLVATVEGHGEGKTILFNLEPGSYSGLDDLTILFDGRPIQLSDNLQDVLEVSADEAEGSVAEYLILVGAQETQVLVQVPHFSVHTIELDGASVGTGGAPTTATIAIAVGGGAAIVFVATTLVGRRRGD